MALSDYHFTKESFKPKFFEEGTYSVKITAVKFDTTENGSDYFELSVEGENGEKGSGRLWLTDKSADWTARTIQSIAVHNAQEDKKDEVREWFLDNVTDGTALFQMAKALAAKQAQCWLTREKQTEPYGADDNGNPKYGYNINFTAYDPTQPKQKADDAEIVEVEHSEAVKSVESVMGVGEVVSSSDVPFL